MSVEEIVRIKLKLEELTPDASLAIEEVGIRIREFCNLLEAEPIPEGLNFTYASMVVDFTKSMENEPDILKSVDMGDTSYTFDTTVRTNKIDYLMRNYEGDMLKYRRIRRTIK